MPGIHHAGAAQQQNKHAEQNTLVRHSVVLCAAGHGATEGNGASTDNGTSDAQPSSSAAEGQLPQSKAPAFLLVHGFGAFGEQWRGQIKALTAAGYQVHLPVSGALNISWFSAACNSVSKPRDRRILKAR